MFFVLQIRLSNKPEDAAIRRIIYSFFSTDGSVLSQKVYTYSYTMTSLYLR